MSFYSACSSCNFCSMNFNAILFDVQTLLIIQSLQWIEAFITLNSPHLTLISFPLKTSLSDIMWYVFAHIFGFIHFTALTLSLMCICLGFVYRCVLNIYDHFGQPLPFRGNVTLEIIVHEVCGQNKTVTKSLPLLQKQSI